MLRTGFGTRVPWLGMISRALSLRPRWMLLACLAAASPAGCGPGSPNTTTPRHHRDGTVWFENDPYFLANAPLLDEVRSTILADIIRRNTPIEDEIQDNLFLVESRA